MKNQFKAATHLEVRNELMQMQKFGGAMINPFVLNSIFECYLSDEEKAEKHYKNKLRSYSYTFCAIANEFYLIYCNDKNPKTEFFISDDRWEKYYISDDIKAKAIDFLQKYDLITCGTKTLSPENKVVQTFKINLEFLKLIRKAAEEIYNEQRAKKYPF